MHIYGEINTYQCCWWFVLLNLKQNKRITEESTGTLLLLCCTHVVERLPLHQVRTSRGTSEERQWSLTILLTCLLTRKTISTALILRLYRLISDPEKKQTRFKYRGNNGTLWSIRLGSSICNGTPNTWACYVTFNEIIFTHIPKIKNIVCLGGLYMPHSCDPFCP